VLDRHKRLYLVCTGETCTLFKLPVASICKQDNGGQTHNHKTISSPKTIVYKLAMIRTIRTQGTGCYRQDGNPLSHAGHVR